MCLSGREAVLHELAVGYPGWAHILKRAVATRLFNACRDERRKIPGLRQLVDDAVQSGLLVAIRLGHRYDALGGSGNVGGWIYRVVLNECGHVLKRARRRHAHELQEHDAHTSVARAVDDRFGPLEEADLKPTEEALRLADRVIGEAALNDEQTRIFDYIRAGHSQQEISRRLGMSGPTVSRRVSQLREQLIDAAGERLLDLLG